VTLEPAGGFVRRRQELQFCDSGGEAPLVEWRGAEMMEAFEMEDGVGGSAVGFGAVFVVPGAEGLVAGFAELDSLVEGSLDARGTP